MVWVIEGEGGERGSSIDKERGRDQSETKKAR